MQTYLFSYKKLFSLSFLLFFIKIPPLFADVPIVFSYQELENLILNRYPTIRNSQYEVDIALDKEKQVEYAQYPDFKFSIAGSPIAPFLYQNRDDGLMVDWGQWKPAFQTRLQFTVPIYDFGRISNLKQAAAYNKEAKQAGVDVIKSDVIVMVKQLYWGYLTYNSYKKYIFDITLPEFEKLVKKKETQFNEGKIGRKTLEDSRIDFLEMKKNQGLLLKQKNLLDGQLSLLVDQGSIETLDIEFKVKYLYSLPIELKPYTFYLSEARDHNPRFKQAQSNELAAKYYAQYQQSNMWPIIGFGMYASYMLSPFKKPDDYYANVFPDPGWKFGFGFGLNWSLDVWDHLVNYDLAQKNYLKVIENIKQASQLLESNLQQSYFDLDFQNTQINYQKEMLMIAQRNFIFTSNAQKTGTASLEDIGETLRDLFTRLRSYYDQVRAFNTAIAQFEQLLGENIINYQKAEQAEIENELLLKDQGETL